jgi:hypothetical protein
MTYFIQREPILLEKRRKERPPSILTTHTQTSVNKHSFAERLFTFSSIDIC